MTDDVFEVELTAMAHEAKALARHDGRTLFVTRGIPGERVRARITQDKGRFAFAEVVEVLESAPVRVQPRCKHFDSCGGCQWQHIDYAAQLAFKRDVVIEQLTRLGGLHDPLVHPTLPNADAWHYRQHITLRLAHDGRPGFVGLDGRVLPIEECHIARPELVEMLVNGDYPDAARPEAHGWAQLRLQVGGDGERLATWIRGGDDHGGAVDTKSKTKVSYTINGKTFQVTGGSFFQVNLGGAATLVDLALDRLAPSAGDRLLDGYCGVGLFTAFMAERAGHVTGIELYAPAVQDARHNLAEHPNVLLVEATLEDGLKRVKGRFDAALIDPPRVGMTKAALAALLERVQRKIVYVSCDPSTLARDAKRLLEAGFVLRDAQPIDLFPQTYLVETVATFERA